ncbi:MAG: hypothetical protein A3H63_00835 [Candidatus Harrisonbacteria bacterium RIFCSPLOWO2_02_FULL_45_10c]|uniref:Transposase IS200-like domain-containing protein n=1 Tax=Candidatus Harrisonbacteria bacterium RIFCSPLOWO2_02_FULL_45_10c TaxID=1798410 RepID=A0A1G1ZSM3_9BACT|nr:MAG: hypothetical protein A3H63_00835 [Candidatus Harrisonbacteria bacterium RIFCSPLOWO2_02_FULL_45_10c]
MKNPSLVSDQIYHIYNRGVEKRKIFLEDEDYLRFIENLYEFNDELSALNKYYRQPYEIGSRNKEREILVEILAFCLMPNHFHLFIRQKNGSGISRFIQKLSIGYSMYFNKKYKRIGPLFQGKFKAVLVNQDKHFIHLPFYIHLNPLDLVAPEWRERKIKDLQVSLNFLNSYRWSSYLDYIGQKNFPSVTQREFLLNFFDGPKNYKSQTEQWLKELDLSNIQDLILE